MLSPIQINQVLKHCEKADKQYKAMNMMGDEGPAYFRYIRNMGWCEALRLVLETDTKSIRNEELKHE